MGRIKIKSEPPEAEHVKTKESYDCHVCKKNFSSQKKLEGHVKTAHPGTKPYRCLICDTSLTRMTSYKEHMNIHTGEKPHKCTVCNEAFATGKSLSRHQEKHEKPADRKCLNCQTKFETWNDFEEHTKTCVKNVPSNARINDLLHSCNVCGLRFQRIGTLNEHMNTHTGNKPFACRWCKDRFPNTKLLRRHILNHDRQNPRCCARCKKQFSDWSEFKKHSNVCRSRLNVCIICNEQFTRKEDMENHYRIDHPDAEKLYKCEEEGCEKRFWHKQLLQIHLRLHAKKKATAELDQPKLPGFKCPVCKTRIENYKKLIEHVKTHLNEQTEERKTTINESATSLLEPKYEMEFTSNDESIDYFDSNVEDTVQAVQVKIEPTEPVDLIIGDVKVKIENESPVLEVAPLVEIQAQKNQKRMKSKNNSKAKGPSKLKEKQNKKAEGPSKLESKDAKTSFNPDFKCTVCGKILMNDKSFKVHCESHTKQPKYECHHCGVRLMYHDSIRRHVKIHFEPKTYGCDVPDCQEKFRNISDARAHVKAHRIETGRALIHTCTICGKSFSRRQILNQHYKIHGDTSFHCDKCPAVFKIVARLRKHMILHTGIKPFGCHICGKHFNAKYNMQCHVLRCINKINGVIEKNFQCTICGKRLSSKSSLNVHLRSHTGQLPYSCNWPDCDMMFHSTNALEKHRREHVVI